MRKLKPVLSIGLFVATFVILAFFLPENTMAALSATSVTLSNSRLSFKAGVNTGTSGSSLITINSSGFPDNNTNHLFPGDVLCFTDAGQNGCIGSTTYTVDSIVDATHFNVTVPLTAAVDTSGYVIATQSGVWTVSFTIANAVPIGGSILITIPASTVSAPATTHDGIPDSAATITNSGFDLNKVVAGSVSEALVSGTCPAGNWSAATVSYGTGGSANPHTISIPRATSICQAGAAMTVTIGTSGTAMIVNPAPITSGHTQGTADVYGITVATRDGGNNVIDSAIPRAAPVEAVLISANVDESLSFVVAGLSPGTYCGNSQTVTTTATSIPWGHIAAPNTFYYAAQSLTVNTNAGSGYTVTIQENDQMGKNGNVCTGSAPSAGQYTFGTGTCIRDTACSASACNYNTTSDWTDPTNYVGLGYSESSTSGTDAPFYYNEKTRAFSTKELPDQQAGGELPQIIMSNIGSVSGSAINVCYRISIPGNQPSGYYYNIVKYTATASF